MSKQIVQLLCLLVAVALAVSDDQSECNHINKDFPTEIVKVFCELENIKNQARALYKVQQSKSHVRSNVIALLCKMMSYFSQKLSEYTCSLQSDTNAYNAVNMTMYRFNRTCKTFTAVNAFKYQLQHYLFHDLSDDLPEVVQYFTSMIIDLQTTAMYLQNVSKTEVHI